MEGDAFIANRREAFKSAYASGQANQLYALPALLHMAHPMLNLQNQIKSQMAASGETVGVRVIGKDDARRQGLDVAGNFYSENRVFADFLIERTKDPAIFGSIAETLGQGRTIEQWLSTTGKAKGLAPTVDGLEQQWREWLALKFGAAAAGLFKQ